MVTDYIVPVNLLKEGSPKNSKDKSLKTIVSQVLTGLNVAVGNDCCDLGNLRPVNWNNTDQTLQYYVGDGAYAQVAGGGGGSGTVNTGAINRLAYYPGNGTIVDDLTAITANRALISNASGLPIASTVTSTTLAFLDATSSVQTQLNSKQATISTGTIAQYFKGDLSLGTFPTTWPLSSLSAAIASNTIDNLNFPQIWGWSTLNGTPLTINHTYGSKSNNVKALAINSSGSSSNTQTYGTWVTNTNTNGTNVAARFTATGATLNHAIIVAPNEGVVGLQNTAPTAYLHMGAGTATAGTAPIKLTTGVALTTPESGAFEFYSSHLYFTIGSTRYQLDQQVGGIFADEETPAGTINSINVTFTLAHTPVAGSVKLFLRGLRMKRGLDYTISGATITMINVPLTGDALLADYRY